MIPIDNYEEKRLLCRRIFQITSEIKVELFIIDIGGVIIFQRDQSGKSAQLRRSIFEYQ